MDILHIFGQYAQHTDSFIAGTLPALIKLKEQLEKAINNGTISDASYYINDGEGYDVRIIVVNKSEVKDLAVPYIADYATETRELTVYPFCKNE